MGKNELKLWTDRKMVHIALPESEITLCGKNIGYGPANPQMSQRMVPTSLSEVEETMREDVWCPYCMSYREESA